MSSAIYGNNNNKRSSSSAAFLNSAPVEISTVEGYQDFLDQTRIPTNTVFSDDKKSAFILREDNVVATVRGKAMDHLLEIAGEMDD